MEAKVKALVYKARDSYKSLPDKKRYLEFFTAVLSVPMLLTVILLNINNLKTTKSAVNIPQPTVQPVREIIYVTPQNTERISTPSVTQTISPTPVPTGTECRQDLPAVTITSPREGDIITDNPVNVNISLQKGNYCAVVWSYKINNGSWSDYDDKSIALYNLSSGNIVLQLKVKSIVTGEETLLKRTFTYGNAVTPAADIQASASAH